jgi:hypothetical protein
MKVWHFSENAYPYLPPADSYDSVRVSLPNRAYDPAKGAALYDRFFDEWLIAEDEGLEIMMNEHHQTPTCVDPAAPLVLAALARDGESFSRRPNMHVQPILRYIHANMRRVHRIPALLNRARAAAHTTVRVQWIGNGRAVLSDGLPDPRMSRSPHCHRTR